MRERLLTWIGVALFGAVVLPWTGCIAFYKHQDVSMRVTDGETRQPLPGAKVEVQYHGYLIWNPPDPAEPAFTGADGMASMRLATFGQMTHWSIEKNGYLRESGAATIGDAKPLRFGQLFRIAKGAHNEIELFRKPAPIGSLLLPQDYRGLVRIYFNHPEARQPQPGQREFEVHVSGGGIARVPHRGVASHLDWMRAVVRYPDGSAIAWGGSPIEATHDDLAVFWISSAMDRLLLYVGEPQPARRLYEFINMVEYPKEGGTNSGFNEHRFGAVFERGEAALVEE